MQFDSYPGDVRAAFRLDRVRDIYDLYTRRRRHRTVRAQGNAIHP